MFMSCRRTSTKRGVAPSRAAAEADATKELGAVITSSPGPTASPLRANIRALVPSPTPTA